VPDPVEIPDKVFFRIGEVARLTGVKSYVLRYWETEFRGLAPRKGKSGQRRYERKDVEFVLGLKDLLWDRKFTIAGARAELSRLGGRPQGPPVIEAGQQSLPIVPPPPPPEPPRPSAPDGLRLAQLEKVRERLLAIRADLARLATDDDLA